MSSGYDVRKGASAYAPIVGGIGGFVVTAVVLVFEIASSRHGDPPALLGHATSLLVLGLISCLLGAFAFGAIGAEQKPTAALPAASLYAGSATAIGAVAIMAAFEALATLYLQDTKPLFALITAGTAISSAVLVALVLGDAHISAPSGHWLNDQKRAYRAAKIASAAVFLPLAGGAILYFMDIRIAVGEAATHWFVGAGIVLSMLGGLGSMFRTMHVNDGGTKSLSKIEAFLVLGCLVLYLLALVLFLP